MYTFSTPWKQLKTKERGEKGAFGTNELDVQRREFFHVLVEEQLTLSQIFMILHFFFNGNRYKKKKKNAETNVRNYFPQI